MDIIKEIDVVLGLKELKDESSDIILADPPYNIGKDFGNNKDNMELKNYIDWTFEWITEAIRVMKNSGTLYIYGFPEIISHISCRFPIKHRWLIWHYTNKTVPQYKFWQRSYEVMLCCWKAEERIFNLDLVREPYTDTFLKNAAGKTRQATKGRYSKGDKLTTYQAHESGALPRDVIEVSALAGGAGRKERWFLCKDCGDAFPSNQKEEHKDHYIIEHPTQKPYKLTHKLLSAAKPEKNGLVVIPFTGTGSECAVAADLNLNYIGFDINPDYIQLANCFLKNRKIE